MKDNRDKQTGNLLASDNARRQARYKESQRKLGRKQKNIWVTPEEEQEIDKLLEQIRELTKSNN